MIWAVEDQSEMSLSNLCSFSRNIKIFGFGWLNMLGVGLMVGVVGLESWDPEFKSHSVVELIPGGVDSACHPSEVDQMSASLLVSCVGVVTHPGLCPIAK